MSGSARWKEDRIRQEVYVEQLKHAETPANGAHLNGSDSPGRTPVLLLQQTFGNRSDKLVPNRRKKNQLPWIILRVALLAGWAAVCLWVYLGQFGIHR
jgi:hypothetical protein